MERLALKKQNYEYKKTPRSTVGIKSFEGLQKC